MIGGTKIGRPRVRRDPGLLVVTVLVSLGALIWLLPILWMISTSLKTNTQVFAIPLRWVPRPPHVAAYIFAASQSSVVRWLLNSIIISASEVGIGVVISALAAYAFARIRFPGRNALFIVVLSTLMIPQQVILIPNYLALSGLGWVDTYWGVVIPDLAGAFGVFLLRQFFQSIPFELEDSATMDGAGRLRIFVDIILPLSVPALTALGIFIMLNSWNNFLWPLIVLQDTSMKTLPIGLSDLQSTYATENPEVLMAASVIASLPILILYLVFQKRVIEGVTVSGSIKG